MKLLVLYGPPAVGKLSVGQELAKITHFKLFHNHIANDVIENFIDYDHKDFWSYVNKIKKTVYKLAIKENINLIITYCYAKGDDDKAHKKFIRKMKDKGAKLYHVQLICGEEELLRRVKHESRRKFGKLKHKKSLKNVLNKYELFSPISFVKNFVIDNTKISPKKSAKMIKDHFRFK